jgi:cyclophilin family peptidyl-prolyl cis-trans isomerase
MRRKKFSAIERASRSDLVWRGMRLPHVMENLESRRLLSLSIDMRIDMGNGANTDPASIIDNHTISGAQSGDVYAIQIWAVIHGSDTDSTNDTLDLLYGSLVASNLRTGGNFGAVQGSFALPTLEPYFASSADEASPGVQYTDADGNVDIGSAINSTDLAANFFHPVVDTSQATPPTNLLNQGNPGAGEEEELATTTFTVTSVVSGPPTTLQFQSRPQIEGEVSAIWFEDGTVQDTFDGATVSPSTGITITEPDAIAPTASATLGPILGSTSTYQFTVNYSDNQDLNTNDFGNNNILVTGPNGYSQTATFVSDVDADPSADPQYDPYDATYQITPPDAAWSAADNGAYTFTLEPNQIADNSGNFAGTTVLGGGPLDVDFLGAVSIAPATAEIGENAATPVVFTVTRTDGANDNFAEPMTVAYSTSGTAVAGTNYVAFSGSVTIPAGQASASISVQPIDDQVVDADTMLQITLTPGGSYTLGSQNVAALTIDNTDLPTVSISPATSAVSENSTTPVTFTVTRANDDVTNPLTVDYSTNASAVAGTNYTALSGLVIIPAGQTSATISVQPIDDDVMDADTSLQITLTSENDYTLGSPASAALTISNADITAVVLSPATADVEENSGPSTFTITRSATTSIGYGSPIMVTYSVGGSAQAGTNYSALTGSVIIPAGQMTATISVQPIDDQIADDSTTVQITLTSESDYSIASGSDAATLTIDNVDIAPTGNSALTSNPGISDSPIGDMNIAAGGAAGSINLANIFTNSYLDGDTIVQMQTSEGNIYLELFDSQAPATVQNFLSYVNSGEYNNTLFYRAISDFVIQTGADYPVDPSGNNFTSATTGDTGVSNINTLNNSPTVQNEYSDTRPNIEGTIAMAKLSTDPNSASTEWFINLGDNSENLDNQNSGFTVFGQVIGSGMTVAQTIGNLPTLSDYGDTGVDIPVLNYQGQSVEADNLVLIPSESVVPAISYSVSSTNTGVVFPSLNGANLSLAYGVGGSAQVTITATDVLGDTKTETFNVTVQPGATPAISLSENNQAISSGQSTAVSFGSVTQGAANPSLAFTIANTGDSALNFSSVSLSGGFKLLSPPASQSIAAGGSETFTVAMPTVTAGTFNGNITFTTNDPNNINFSVPISGVVSEATTAPTQLAFTTEPGNNTSGNVFSVAVTVEDANGNVVSNDNSQVTLSIASGPAGATLGSTLTATAVNGVAMFSNLTLNRAGAFTLMASDGQLTTATSSSFNVAYASLQLIFAQQPATATAGSKFSLQIDTDNPGGSADTGAKSKIKIMILSGPTGGKITGGTSGTSKNGVANFKNLAIDKAGTYTLEAIGTGGFATGESTITITPAAAAKIEFNPQPGNASASLPFNVSVELFDRYGNVATGTNSTVNLALGTHPKGTAMNVLSETADDGFADFDGITLGTAGNYSFSASDGKLKGTSKKFVLT